MNSSLFGWLLNAHALQEPVGSDQSNLTKRELTNPVAQEWTTKQIVREELKYEIAPAVAASELSVSGNREKESVGISKPLKFENRPPVPTIYRLRLFSIACNRAHFACSKWSWWF